MELYCWFMAASNCSDSQQQEMKTLAREKEREWRFLPGASEVYMCVCERERMESLPGNSELCVCVAGGSEAEKIEEKIWGKEIWGVPNRGRASCWGQE